MIEILSDLENLGYNGPFSEGSLNDESCNVDFIQAIAWLSSQLSALYDLENQVTPLSDFEDLLGFWVELSCLLKELGCPYKSLTTGDITERLSSLPEKQLLLRFLTIELQAAKILASKNVKPSKSMEIEIEESKTATELKEMLMSLKFSKPPDSITPNQLFGQVEKKLKALSQPLSPQKKVGELLFSGCLTEKQWFHLEYLFKEMAHEYETRRSLLMTRLDVTVRSFLWAERLKNVVNNVISNYDARKAGLRIEPQVKISNILSAKSCLALVEKTSSASVRKNAQSSVNKVVIGAVPDRGGRPEEQQPPPPEVPSWQKNPPPRSQQPAVSKNTFNESSDRNKPNIYEGANLRADYAGNRMHQSQPFYQPVNYYSQIPNQQLEFGGYKPAGDNFQQYGMPDNNMYQQSYGSNQPRGGFRGNNPRPRGGSFRGNDYRGRFRGRGR